MTPRLFFEWTLAVAAGALMALVVVGFAVWLYLHQREAYWAQREVEQELLQRDPSQEDQ
jgi:hypothetical protein